MRREPTHTRIATFRPAIRSSYSRFRGGAVHRPSSASGFGQYSRNTVKKGPFGAGSQLDSLSWPGDSCCTHSVTPPSASCLSVGSIGELIR